MHTIFSSKYQDWETPLDLFNQLNSEFHFDLDVCAVGSNAKCIKYYSPFDDGLKQDWKGICWMNPPYGRKVKSWIQKAYQSSLNGATVVCLLPSRTDTAWWHDFVLKGEIRFIRGRLLFNIGDTVGRAPFPSVVVIFRPSTDAV